MTESRKVQLFVPTFRVDETLAEIRQCLERGWTGLGYKTEEFEKAWCEYTGLPHAHFLNSATGGLHLAVEILRDANGWKPGDEIITTPITFVSTNHAILYAGLRPVFADIDQSMNLSVESVQSRVTPRTRAVMFVGMGGNTANLASMARFCHEKGLTLILDAAHMAGARIDGVHVGQEADVAIFSFQAVKNLPTADSGMICFRRGDLDAEARKRSWLGIDKNTFQRTEQRGSYRWEYDVETTGYKYNGNSVMAAIGLVALRYLDQDNAYRRQIAQWYDASFDYGELDEIIEAVRHDAGSARHLYQARVKNRDALMVFLNANDIFPGVHYKDNRCYRMYEESKPEETCPVAWEASEELISLPMHIRMTYQDVKRVATTVRSFYEKKT